MNAIYEVIKYGFTYYAAVFIVNGKQYTDKGLDPIILRNRIYSKYQLLLPISDKKPIVLG